jgi:ketosteroid isomerase-like protein
MNDRPDDTEVIRAATAMGMLVDQRDWDAVTRLFTDQVEVDYTSLNGGEPMTVAATDLIRGWQANLRHLDATQHLVAGHLVTLDGDTATCVSNVQGTHVLANNTGGPHWTVGGRYHMRFTKTDAGWKMNALTLTVSWATGNQAIMTPPDPDH